jgi:hypothetical protein
MARREVTFTSIGARAEHLATCSPCFSEYFAAREKWKQQRRQTIAILATAAGLAAAILGVILVREPVPVRLPNAPPVAEQRRPDPELRSAILDLRPLDVTRGEPNISPAAPLLAKANLRLTILLPIGSDEGNYEFQIRDGRGAPLIQGAGMAIIRNYITTIETALDLRPLNPGQFTWVIRRTGETSWRTYPLKVH